MLQIVLTRAIGAAIGMVLIAVIYVILQNLAQKGVRVFQHEAVRWICSFIIGILLFILGASILCI